ncbi:MAG: sodium/proline symporter [Deltaproteobacteria bacterium]|nr:MAG: sodium/proline symporter [Deltaproteobacteria bacterium]
MNKVTVILVTLVLYKVVLVVLGLWAQRRTRDGSDYFLGGRQLGPWVAALSASASSSSAWTLMGVSGFAYAYGLSSLWLIPACVGGFALNWYVLAGPLQAASREQGALTTTELLAGPPGHQLRSVIVAVASLIILVSLTVYVASQFQGAGKAFKNTFQMGLTPSILLGSGVVVFYTMLGGFWAVSLTDTLQGAMMALTAILLPVGALVAVGGPSQMIAGLQSIDAPGYLSLFGNRSLTPGLLFAVAILGIGLGYTGQPHVVNRFMALRDDPKALRTARRVAMTWAWVVYIGMVVLGLCGRLLVQKLGDNEVIFVQLANQLFHPVLSGVMLAAVLSAIMSTADSQLLVAASAVSHDWMKPATSDKQTVFRARVVVVLISAAAVLLALYGSKKIFSSVLFAWSAMGNAFGPLLLLTVLRRRVPPLQTLLAMLAGFGLSVLFYSHPATHKTLFERVVPFVVCLLIAAWPIKSSERGDT